MAVQSRGMIAADCRHLCPQSKCERQIHIPEYNFICYVLIKNLLHACIDIYQVCHFYESDRLRMPLTNPAAGQPQEGKARPSNDYTKPGGPKAYFVRPGSDEVARKAWQSQVQKKLLPPDRLTVPGPCRRCSGVHITASSYVLLVRSLSKCTNNFRYI